MGDELPILAISSGDPAGVGPEVLVQALRDPSVRRMCRPLVIGDARILQRAANVCGVEMDWEPSDAPPARLAWPGEGIALLDQPVASDDLPAFGALSADAGRAAVRAVEAAIDLTVAGNAAGMVTAPLNKEAMRLAGYTYDGHTELLAVRTHSPSVCMLLAGERLRVAHVTGHRSLREAAVCPSAARVIRVIELTWQALQRLGIDRPRIAVAGLNPHAGEGGLFGRDEIEVIGPAIESANLAAPGAEISGPYPADTIFRRAAAGEFDAVVAMYHDQGHIPIKMIEFDTAVNVTLGLPIVRTSPDHGTAFDIAGKGIANPANMVAAIKLAARMCA